MIHTPPSTIGKCLSKSGVSNSNVCGASRKHENLKQAQTRCNRTLQLAIGPGGWGSLALLFYEGLPQDPLRPLISSDPQQPY